MKIALRSLAAAVNPHMKREERNCHAIASMYDLGGFSRIYLVHIRKTGGTSINNMFLSLSGGDPGVLYAQLARAPGHRLLNNGLIYVGWNVHLLNRGNYFYGFSHTPLHELNLPAKTFTLTCFRDPIKRVLSHYNMLMDFRLSGTNHPCMRTEGKWLGNSFEDFIQRIPRHHLMNQLYMFSRHFSVDEAVANALGLSYHFFGDDFRAGVDQLRHRTGLALEPLHIRSASQHAEPSGATLSALRERLNEEYVFLERVRKCKLTAASGER